MSSAAPLPLLVVLDVNIYLTVARELGPNFSQTTLTERITQAPPVSTSSGVFPMLQTLMHSYPDGAPIEIHSGRHIIDTALYKAEQPKFGRTPEDAGLGWDRNDIGCIAQTISNLVKTTGGQILSKSGTFMAPPLDYEDGCVMKCALDARGGGALFRRYCITYDRQMTFKMAQCHQVTVCSPENWCIRVRAARASAFFSNIAK